ncbi:uncharacterized protein N0V89_005202 [Didymosphaeria variabile]|uniref:Uncharacterized protein n=1 Tax=Didymosphaeria variabile TaxID=1932322 RepID=A0A9W8XKD2_9PLEO|nr:uncharacterized protein N0V89_005202 [Didymosphaeria variabile]KAJ4353472.1 hypothetical protein N0V89_005202 [Didymosphaeria variabile]
MAVCTIDGNSDMYGLGIRLGYYFLWYGAILARWMAPSEVKNVAFSTDMFVAATFLALIILTESDIDNLEPAETYIVLLLMFGAYLALVPIYVWRLLTACDPYWVSKAWFIHWDLSIAVVVQSFHTRDIGAFPLVLSSHLRVPDIWNVTVQDPTRYPRVNLGAMSANLSFILLIGVLVFQYWFWFDRVPDLDHRNCQQYGFVFGQVRLNSKVSVVLHALMYFWLGLVCLYIFLLKFRALAGLPDPGVGGRRPKRGHIEFLQNLDVWIRIVIALAVTVATELTISWNEIGGVFSLSGAGQTIPFAIGLTAIVRILYVAMKPTQVHQPHSRPSSVRQVPQSFQRRPRRDTESTISRPSRVYRR